MKTHQPTTRRPRRTRRSTGEAVPQGGQPEAMAPERSLETLREPRASQAARGVAARDLQRVVGNAIVARELAQREGSAKQPASKPAAKKPAAKKPLDPEAERVRQLQANYAAAVKGHNWAWAAELLNGFNDADLEARVIKLSPASRDQLRKAALKAMPNYSTRVTAAIDKHPGPLTRAHLYDTFIEEASAEYGIPADQIRAVIATESAGLPEATSGAAFGLMQITKQTWNDTQKANSRMKPYDFANHWKDPRINILFGTAVLKSSMTSMGAKPGDVQGIKLAITAYNAGPATVKKAMELAKAAGSKDPDGECLQPDYLKPAIETTGIYSYYLTGGGWKRNPHVESVIPNPKNQKLKTVSLKDGSTLEDAKAVAIDLKFQEISRYPERVSGYIAQQSDE